MQIKPKWLKVIDNEVFEKRRLLSKCVAEIQRLKENSRMTRKTKRNRGFNWYNFGIHPYEICVQAESRFTQAC